MSSLKQQYKELLEQTQKYLLQEYSCRDSVLAKPEDYTYFSPHFQKLKREPVLKPAPPPPAVQPIKPPPPVVKQPSAEVIAAPPPEPKPAEKAEEPKKGFSLEPPPKVSEPDLRDVRKIVQENFPQLAVHDNPPVDSEAKAQKERLRFPEVIILSFGEPEEQTQFLSNVCRAIDQQLAPAVIYPAEKIHRQNKWEAMTGMKQLRLIIATDVGINSYARLKEMYRESANKTQRYLGGVPILLLPDLSLYLNQPDLKRSLWKALQQLLKSR